MKDVPIQEQIDAARERCKHWLERSKELRARGLEKQARFADQVSEMWLARQRRLYGMVTDKPTRPHYLTIYRNFSILYFVLAVVFSISPKLIGFGIFLMGMSFAYLIAYLDWRTYEKRTKKQSEKNSETDLT